MTLNKDMNHTINLMLLTILLGLFSGCTATSTTKEQASQQTQDYENSVPSEIRLTEFILGIGDTLEITVYRNRNSERLIWIGDLIDIKVYRNEDLNKSIHLGPTGRIMMPLIGDIEAVGKNELELRDDIRQKLSRYINDPQVTISIIPNQGLKIADLTMSAKIDPTGRIFYPLVGKLQASGKSLFQLQAELQEKLADRLIEPQVVISVSDVKSQKIMVLGEVNNPGVYALDSSITLIEAIGKAAGANRDAELSNVVLIRKDHKQTQILLYDLKEILTGEATEKSSSPNVSLISGDIVYVPVTRIASVSRFFDYLSSILKPIIDLERGIIFWPDVKDVLKGNDIRTPTAVAI